MRVWRGKNSKTTQRGLLAGVIASVLAFAGIGLVAAPAAGAAEHPAYPYETTFVWQLGPNSTPAEPFNDVQQLVAWQVDEGPYATTPAYTQVCGAQYQVDHYRITNDADQATLDGFVDSAELAGPTDTRIGMNWSRAHGDAPYYSYEPATPLSCGMPVAPTVTPAVCTAPGQASTPTVTFAESDDITYSIDGTVAAGATVTVIATPVAGYVLEAADGWTLHADGTATLTLTFAAADCPSTVAPVNPVVTQSQCVGDDPIPTDPSVTLAGTPGISYAVEGTFAPGGTVTVTATPEPGYSLAAADGWTAAADGSATLRITFEDHVCSTWPGQGKTPLVPTVTQAACVAGSSTPSAPVLVMDDTSGITYTASGPAVAGTTIAVTATVDKAFVISHTLDAAWTRVSQWEATTTVAFDAAPECPAPTASAAPAAAKPALAATGGTDMTPLALGAAALLVAGAIALILRRRHTSDAS